MEYPAELRGPDPRSGIGRARIAKVFNNLEIKAGRTSTGAYVAQSEKEPLFCFERDSRDDLIQLVTDTIVSYAKTFFGVDAQVQFRGERKPPEAALPVEDVKPDPSLFASVTGSRKNGKLVQVEVGR